MFCAECGAPEMRRTNDAFEEMYRGEKMRIAGVPHWVCDACGEMEFESQDLKLLNQTINDNIRRTNGLLSADEIKAIRKAHNLNQQQFEAVLGVTSPTVCRWETGAVVQSKPLDSLMRAFRDHDCVADDMMRRAEIAKIPPVSIRTCVTMRNILDISMERDGIVYVS